MVQVTPFPLDHVALSGGQATQSINEKKLKVVGDRYRLQNKRRRDGRLNVSGRSDRWPNGRRATCGRNEKLASPGGRCCFVLLCLHRWRSFRVPKLLCAPAAFIALAASVLAGPLSSGGRSITTITAATGVPASEFVANAFSLLSLSRPAIEDCASAVWRCNLVL
jgi:hypothetical protein